MKKKIALFFWVYMVAAIAFTFNPKLDSSGEVSSGLGLLEAAAFDNVEMPIPVLCPDKRRYATHCTALALGCNFDSCEETLPQLL